MIRYANSILKNLEKSEEVVQEALIKLLLAAPELNNKNHALAYLKKTIENLALDFFRLQGRRPNLVAVEELEESDLHLQNQLDHSDVISAAEDAAVIRQALSLLSPAERAALVMWEIEGRSAKEIASELGIKEHSVRHTVSRARTSMRRILSEIIIDEERGLTALDLLSTSVKNGAKLAQKTSKVALSLMLLVFAFMGFTNLNDSPVTTNLVKSETSVTNLQDDDVDSIYQIPQSNKEKEIVVSNTSKISNSEYSDAKATKLAFPGLDINGLPIAFSVTDSTGAIGKLYFNGKETLMNETGLILQSITKTSSGAANIFLNQTISQDALGTNYDVIISFGRNRSWVPVVSRVVSSETERLMNGNYLLTAVIQVKSEVETSIVIPASSEGRDLEVAPSRVVTRILLNSTKTQILAQAVQVIEKAGK